MTTRCEHIQAMLAESGVTALRHDAASRQHLVECANCFDLLEALSELDGRLAALPAIDAPDAAVAASVATASASELETVSESGAGSEAGSGAEAGSGSEAASEAESGSGAGAESGAGAGAASAGAARASAVLARRRRLMKAGVLAGGLAAAASLLLVFESDSGEQPMEPMVATAPPASPAAEPTADDVPEALEDALEEEAQPVAQDEPAPEPAPKQQAAPIRAMARREQAQRLHNAYRDGAGRQYPDVAAPKKERPPPAVRTLLSKDDSAPAPEARTDGEVESALGQIGTIGRLGPAAEVLAQRAQAGGVRAESGAQIDESLLDAALGKRRKQRAAERSRRPASAIEEKASTEFDEGRLSGPRAAALDLLSTRPSGFASRKLASPGMAGKPRDDASRAAPPSSGLLARFERTEGLAFKQASGYWQNTYVPGDPRLRTLYARLLAQPSDLLSPYGANAAQLDDAAQRYTQPFDAPEQAALGLFLNASERGATGPRRMLLQVGIAATPRYGGRRPAMNVGVVLDLRERPSTEAAAGMRAVVEELSRARDLSDRFSLIVAGRPGGVVVPAAAFRHGPLAVVLRRLLEDAPGGANGETLSLTQAVSRAVELVQNDDDNAPLCSSAVMVVTATSLAGELEALEPLAHRSAVAGVPVSAIGIGRGAALDPLTRLALSGQGNRRLLSGAADAARVVDRELSAVARVVARAVRLRIRLAPDVKLVDVLGSRRLDELHAERVRQAEQSIDRRIAKSLGIAADRGEDEEGIQIVIPSFYAGDTHVVLLDVVAPGPGALADVTARYKDLVQVRNGVSRANLSLGNRELSRGPLQLSVLKNLLGYELAQRLAQAGDALSDGSPERAQQALGEALALLDGVGEELPGLRADRGLYRDRALVTAYRALLNSGAARARRDYLTDSLRLASLLKQLPRPEWEHPTDTSQGERR